MSHKLQICFQKKDGAECARVSSGEFGRVA